MNRQEMAMLAQTIANATASPAPGARVAVVVTDEEGAFVGVGCSSSLEDARAMMTVALGGEDRVDHHDDHERPVEVSASMLRWDALASVLGYNELAKQVETLGEKAFCRTARDHAEAEYIRLGGEVVMSPVGQLVVQLRERPPHIIFREPDIELMRAAVRAHDEKKPAPDAPADAPSDAPAGAVDWHARAAVAEAAADGWMMAALMERERCAHEADEEARRAKGALDHGGQKFAGWAAKHIRQLPAPAPRAMAQAPADQRKAFAAELRRLATELETS
ncbi:MAG: hypothetical protein ACHREM_09105 [Polyangiales bacterium]